MKKKELIKHLLENIESISGQWKKELSDSNKEALEYYKAEELDLGEKKKKNVSKYVSATLSDAINWAMPTLMDIYAGSDEIFKSNPREASDVEAAEGAEKLANYQLFARNKWYLFCYDWIFDCLLYRQGIAKVQFISENKNTDIVRENISAQELELKLSDPTASLLSHEVVSTVSQMDSMGNVVEIPQTYNATIRYTVKDEYNLIEALPCHTVGYDLTTRDVDNIDFFYHREDLKPWQIKKKYGDKVFKRVEKMTNEIKENSNAFENEEFKDLGGSDFITNDKDLKGKYSKYECYYIDPDTGSYMIAEIIGEELLAEPVLNKYGRIPIRIITAFRQPHRIAGWSMHNKLKQFARLSTAIMRQLLNNLYYNNEGKYIISRNAKIDLDEWQNSSGPGSYIECDGDPNAAVSPLIPAALQPWAFQMLERVTQEIEFVSGVPRSFKGIDVGTLNKTFRGQAQQINQASQILKAIARLIAEMGFIPLVKDVIDNSIKFMSQEQSFRIAEKFYKINPDNLIGNYDWMVNVGIGVDNKDQTIMRMQQLLGIYAQVKKMNVPIATAKDAYNALRELVKAMGFKNVDDFSTDPQEIESVQALIMAIIQHVQTIGMPAPEILEPLQKVIAIFGMPGMPGEKQGQKGAETRPNQEVPHKPPQPMQPMQEVSTLDGNQHFG